MRITFGSALSTNAFVQKSLGIFASGVVLRLGPASEWLLWPLPALLSPFAAVFYPLAVLPHWMQWVSYALPPSYVFEGMRALLADRPFPGILLLQGSLVAAFELLLAAHFYGRVYRHAVRTGLSARRRFLSARERRQCRRAPAVRIHGLCDARQFADVQGGANGGAASCRASASIVVPMPQKLQKVHISVSVPP
jgi:hypothetical protein